MGRSIKALILQGLSFVTLTLTLLAFSLLTFNSCGFKLGCSVGNLVSQMQDLVPPQR